MGGAKREDFSADRRALLDHALAFPEAWVDTPWGDTVVKVRRKVFVFFGPEEGPGGAGHLGLSVKLPHSGPEALSLPFCSPTGYGLGRHGWVTARFEPGETPLLGLMRDWIEESYRAVAPKTLTKTLGAAAK